MQFFSIGFILFVLIKILVFFLSDDTLEKINETGPRDVIHMLALVQEDGMSESVCMQDLLREDLSIMMEVIDSEPAKITGQEDVDIAIARVAMERTLDVLSESTMTEAQCDIVGTEIISEFT